MERLVLTDAQWAKMEPLCLGKPGDPGRSGKDNRLFVEAVLWIVRTGSPWRDLPPSFGNWNSIFTRFRDWVKADVWQRSFEGHFFCSTNVLARRKMSRGAERRMTCGRGTACSCSARATR